MSASSQHLLQAARNFSRATSMASSSSLMPSSATAATLSRRAVAGPMTSSPLAARSGSLSQQFSTSCARWSTEAEKAKATEDQVGADVMGAKEHAPEGEQAKATSEAEKQMAEKDKQIKELKDQLLYGRADLQNAQRRVEEVKKQATDFGITKFARDLTSSLDVLALALRSVPEQHRKVPSDATSAEDPRKLLGELYSGVELTSKSILDMLKTYGVTQFDPTGQKFDPNQHEALFEVPMPGKEPGTVLECSKSGFMIKDRVLRAAQVGVVREQA